MDNQWMATSLWQCILRSCTISHAEYFSETSNHPGDSVPLPPRFCALRFLAFPKLKSPLKEKRFHTIDEIQENMMGQLMTIGRTLWGSKVPTLKGTEASLSYVQCFLYLVSSSINVSIFHITWLDTLVPSGQTLYLQTIYTLRVKYEHKNFRVHYKIKVLGPF